MMYDKQSLTELSLTDRLLNHQPFQQRFTKEEARIQGARCGLWHTFLSDGATLWQKKR